MVNDNRCADVLMRVRDAYPKTFPGDLASIKLIELHTATGEDHLVERDVRLFEPLSQPPVCREGCRPAKRGATKFKSHAYSIAAIFPMSGNLRASSATKR